MVDRFLDDAERHVFRFRVGKCTAAQGEGGNHRLGLAEPATWNFALSGQILRRRQITRVGVRRAFGQNSFHWGVGRSLIYAGPSRGLIPRVAKPGAMARFEQRYSAIHMPIRIAARRR